MSSSSRNAMRLNFCFLVILGIDGYDMSYDIKREDTTANRPVTCLSSAMTVMGPGKE